jgi:hypothetical protein
MAMTYGYVRFIEIKNNHFELYGIKILFQNWDLNLLASLKVISVLATITTSLILAYKRSFAASLFFVLFTTPYLIESVLKHSFHVLPILHALQTIPHLKHIIPSQRSKLILPLVIVTSLLTLLLVPNYLRTLSYGNTLMFTFFLAMNVHHVVLEKYSWRKSFSSKVVSLKS